MTAAEMRAYAERLWQEAERQQERLPRLGGEVFSAALADMRHRREQASHFKWLAENASRRETQERTAQ